MCDGARCHAVRLLACRLDRARTLVLGGERERALELVKTCAADFERSRGGDRAPPCLAVLDGMLANASRPAWWSSDAVVAAAIHATVLYARTATCVCRGGRP